MPERVKEVLLELLLLVLVVVLLVMAAALALSLLSKLLSHVGQRSEAAGTMQSELARMVGVAVCDTRFFHTIRCPNAQSNAIIAQAGRQLALGKGRRGAIRDLGPLELNGARH